jgi:hypothetical protein
MPFRTVNPATGELVRRPLGPKSRSAGCAKTGPRLISLADGLSVHGVDVVA